MSQLYAKVFTQILDSSIAEDFEVRHVFEDFLKVCTIGDNGGVVDMTRQALSRKFNVPLDKLNRAIERLEAPDPNSRNQDFEGRRLVRIDDHRDWGWRIVNWVEYEKLKTKADVASRVAKHRAKATEFVIPDIFKDSPEFVFWWSKWWDHLMAKRKPPTIHAQELQLDRLGKMGLEKALATIKHSIECSYQGLYEPGAQPATNKFGQKLATQADAVNRQMREIEEAEKRVMNMKI